MLNFIFSCFSTGLLNRFNLQRGASINMMNVTNESVYKSFSKLENCTVENDFMTTTFISYTDNYFTRNGSGDYNITTNDTFLENAPTLTKSSLIRVTILTGMAVISLLGNIATMWSIQKNRASRRLARHNWSAIYSLIFHLSIADVLVTGFCIIGEGKNLKNMSYNIKTSLRKDKEVH